MKRLILMGQIGAGKTTLIRSALRGNLHRAGGFVTRRILEKGVLLGFDLASPGIWEDPEVPSRRFLDFTRGGLWDDRAFSQLGAELLEQAMAAPFCVADEFGGLELLVPEFYEGLLRLLTSDIPLIGVMKTPEAVAALAEKVPLGKACEEAYTALLARLAGDPETILLPIRGWDDENAVDTVRIWTEIHVRR